MLNACERTKVGDRQVGFRFESFNLTADLTVYQNAELLLTDRGMPIAERSEHVRRALKRVDMGHRTKHNPSRWSGGQQQRVALAQALAGYPAVLLRTTPRVT